MESKSLIKKYTSQVPYKSKKQNYQVQRISGKCYKCGDIGHWASFCYN